MQIVQWVLIVVGIAAVAWFALVAIATISIPAAPASHPRPTRQREEALKRLEDLQALDTDVLEQARTRLHEPEAPSDTTVIIWHGFTNAPSQFTHVAERFQAAGYRVLVPRMPRHGLANVLNRDLADLTSEELAGHVDTCVDIAAGLGSRVWVVGFSAGGVLASWAAATRPEVERVVLTAPFVAPKAVPLQAIRVLVRFRPLVPGIYVWWDPRKRENLGEGPHTYPGFPLPALTPFLHLAQLLDRGRVKPGHRLRRVVLVTNPGDFAIRRDAARAFTFRVFSEHADLVAEATLDATLGWWHDFVDPWGPHVGTTDEVAPIFFSALGIAEDTTCEGRIVAPAPPADPHDPAANEA